MPSKRTKNGDGLPRKGRSENLNRGRKQGDRPARKLPEQKVTEFCLHYLTHGESVKAAGLHVGLADTYVYEFFQKPQVQARLKELRAQLGEKLLQNAANEVICARAFIDKHLAAIISNPDSHPTRGFSDQIAAARLAADMNSLIDKGKQQYQPAPMISAQIIHNNLGSDVYMTEFDRRRLGIHDERSIDLEQRLLGSTDSKTAALGTENKGSDDGAE